jgi:hypothetical protein
VRSVATSVGVTSIGKSRSYRRRASIAALKCRSKPEKLHTLRLSASSMRPDGRHHYDRAPVFQAPGAIAARKSPS